MPKTSKMAPMSLPDAIKAAYAGRMKQTELALALGRDQTTVSKWATGKVMPTVDDIAAVEDACDRPRGFVLRLAGYVEDATTPEEAILADASISDDAREFVLAGYRHVRAQGPRR